MSNGVTFQNADPATPPVRTKIKTTYDNTNGHIQHVALSDNADIPLVETRANTGVRALTVAVGPTDPISDVPVMIDYDHHQVHEGESHGYSNLTATLAAAANKDFRINVPSTLEGVAELPHMVIEVITTLEAEAYLYEGMTYNAGNGGTERTSYNRNRSSDTAAATKIYEDPTAATTGTNLWIGLTGSANRAGSGSRSLTEWVLKSDTDYLFRVTSRANGCKVLIRLEWYEDKGV